MDNIRQIIHCTAFILTSNKLHMDVHQWVENILLTENSTCLICNFLEVVTAYEDTKVKQITFTSHN